MRLSIPFSWGQDPPGTTPSAAPAQSVREHGEGNNDDDKPAAPVNLREKFANAIATVMENNRSNAKSSQSDAIGSGDRAGGGSSHGLSNGSGHGPGGHGGRNGSGHGAVGASGGGVGGVNQRRASMSGSTGGSRHSAVGVGSMHSSAIPEDGAMDWGSEHATGGETGGGGFLGELGKQLNLALSTATTGSEHGSVGSAGGGSGDGAAAAAKGRSMSASGDALAVYDYDKAGSGGGGGGHQFEGESAGFLGQVGRMVSTFSLGGGNSDHGSGWGGSAGAGSGHGSLAISGGGAGAGGSDHGSAVAAGAGSGRRPSGILLPWSQHSEDGDHGRRANGSMSWRAEDASPSDHGSDRDVGNVLEGVKRGVGRALSSMAVVPGPSPATNDTSSLHDLGSSSSSVYSVGGRRAAAVATASGIVQGAGYEAAMSNWPAGKVCCAIRRL